MADTTTPARLTPWYARLGDDGLEDDPIDPAQVLSGNPRARVRCWATSSDQTTSHWIWDCTAGVFRWYTSIDETIVIVDGSARLTPDGAETVELGVGDAAYFRAGSWIHWEIDEYVRKQAVLRVPIPRGMRYAVNGIGRRTHRLS